MKVGINILYLIPGVVGGTETYAAGLLRGIRDCGMENEYVLFLNKETADWGLKNFPDFARVVCPVDGARREHRYAYEQFRLPALVKQHGVDVLHSLGYTSPLMANCPTVVTVHDLNFRSFGWQMPFRRRIVLGFFVKQSIHRATRVIAVSNFSRNEILRHYRVSPGKIHVTHEAAQETRFDGEVPAAAEAMFGIRTPYCVAFSSSSPNKNIPRLIEAFAGMKQESQVPHQLVLVGHKFPGLVTSQNKGFKPGDVVQTGYIDTDLLPSLLGGAEMLVFPSLYEGFGLPVLEAMAAGVPVVSSKAGSLPEVAGDAAVFFDPLSVEDMKKKIVSVATSPELRNNLREKGFENLKRFSWKKTATQTKDIYKQAFEQYHSSKLNPTQ